MAARKKQGTLSRIGRSVSDAAKTVVSAAEEYVVEPVGNLFGVGGKKATNKATKKTTKKPVTKKPASKPAVKETRVTALKKKSAPSAAGKSTRGASAKRPAAAKRK